MVPKKVKRIRREMKGIILYESYLIIIYLRVAIVECKCEGFDLGRLTNIMKIQSIRVYVDQ